MCEEITMQDLIDEIGFMDEACDRCKIESSTYKYPKHYKGFLIEFNTSNDFGKGYYTAINTKNNTHCHDISEKLIYKICDCACYYLKHNVMPYRYHKSIRSKAMRLLGTYIKG